MIKFFDLYKQDRIYHKKIISEFKKNITKTNYILEMRSRYLKTILQNMLALNML